MSLHSSMSEAWILRLWFFVHALSSISRCWVVCGVGRRWECAEIMMGHHSIESFEVILISLILNPDLT